MTKWRKSTSSQASSDCVEIADTLDQLRDSKNPGGPVLHANIKALIRSAKQDDFGRC